MEDVTMQVLDIRALDVNEGDQHLTIAMMAASQVQTPFAGPDGQPVVLTVPTKIVRVIMGKQGALELIESLQAQVDNLPDEKRPSNLVIPASMQQAEQAAENLKRFGA